ncbi:MAG: hypothetical protein NXI04_05540 [Planctomycetaceae bacterium]|nr:hypothetical protein [Planctomycetaceae bacterium]
MRFLFPLIASLQLICLTLRADELALRTQPKSDQLLVLRSGRVIRGALTPRQQGYDIVQPGGRIFVGSEQVHFLADDIEQAWQKLRDSKQELTPDTHLELARWCLEQKLYGKAKQEILDALHLDPYRGDAKRMLAGLVQLENSAGQPRMTQAQKVAERLREVREHGALAPQRRSLGGLPEDLALEFTRTIQPLLSNKCGNARCHGPGQNDFVVLNIRRGVTPVRSEQNLAALIGQMDFEHPEQSPVLKATYGLHGGSRALLFPGQSGGRLRQKLKDWVQAAAVQMDPALPEPLSATTDGPKSRGPQHSRSLDVPSAGRKTVSAESTADGIDRALARGTLTQASYRREQSEKFVHEANVASRHDDFNPDEFNQMVHGRTRSEARGVTQGAGHFAEPQTYLNQAFSEETSRKASR